MGAGTDLVRQGDAAEGAVLEPLAVDQDALRPARVLIDDEADQIAVVLVRRPDARRERRLAGVAAFGQADRPALAGLQVVLDEAVEQEPARLGRGAVEGSAMIVS